VKSFTKALKTEESNRITLYESRQAARWPPIAAAQADQKLYREERTAPNRLLERRTILSEAGVFGRGRLSPKAMEPDLLTISNSR
jgi:hypothetical protein